jgi:pyruvate dehydrogenase E2 component (dihydrolipoamide acetyltransferase)
MPTSVVMPALEMAQETGKLISWLKKEGETVAKGEPLLEIETDKAVMEIEAPADGVLAGVKAEAGAEIQVGRTIAWIVKPGEAAPAEEAENRAELGRKFADVHSQVSGQRAVREPGPSGEIRISPKARRLAKEKGVDLARVLGSGPGGEILAADIEAAQVKAGMTEPFVPSHGREDASAAQAMSAAHVLSPVARLMAERTAQSWTTVPHFFVTREIDAEELKQARQTLAGTVERSHQVKLTYGDLLAALVARVLTKHPRLNASWAGDSVGENPEINLSLAMAVGDGVVAPVIRNADKAELGTIAVKRRDLTERARGNKLRPADLVGGTFTISNLGMYDVDSFTAIITPPQSAILAVGRIADRVVAVNGQAAVRPTIALTLSVDHRVADGARAAEFMRDLADAIGNPWLRLEQRS